MRLDFSEMEYDPTVEGKMVDVYPELSVYEEFTIPNSVGYDTLDSLVRYCLLWLDEDSPFYRVKDLVEKTTVCIKHAKCGTEAIKEIESDGPDYRKVLLRVLRLSNNYLFDEWWSRKLAYHSDTLYLSAKLDPGNEEKMVAAKIKIKASLTQDRETLLDLESSLFKDKKTKKAVTKAANEASLDGYAERFSVNFFEEEKNSPYQ